MIAVCGIGMPSGWRNRAVTANQSASAPTIAASENARTYPTHPSPPFRVVTTNTAAAASNIDSATAFMRRSARSLSMSVSGTAASDKGSDFRTRAELGSLGARSLQLPEPVERGERRHRIPHLERLLGRGHACQHGTEDSPLGAVATPERDDRCAHVVPHELEPEVHPTPKLDVPRLVVGSE